MINVLHFLFIKGVEINLNDETFKIIKIKNGETTSCNNISDWFSIFVTEGNVSPNDIINFLTFHNVGYLKEHFKNSDIPITLNYSRRNGNSWEPVKSIVTKSVKWTEDNPIVVLGIMPI